MPRFALTQVLGYEVLVSQEVLGRFSEYEVKAALRHHKRGGLAARETKHRFAQSGTIYAISNPKTGETLLLTPAEYRNLKASR